VAEQTPTSVPVPGREGFRSRRPGKRFIALAIGLVAVGVVWTFWDELNQWGFRRALPSSAQEVQEWSYSDAFIGDYIYKLKAQISEDDFYRYIERLGLTAHTADRRYTQSTEPWLMWRDNRPATPWWDPSESLATTFVKQSGDQWTFAKRERGYLYLKSLVH
jgi:hypothetical protein